MAEVIDARGKSCPMPVVMTKKRLDEIDTGSFDVLVDNVSSSDNVARFVKDRGCLVEVEQKDGIYVIHVTKGTGCDVAPGRPDKEKIIFIGSNTVGRGDDELGTILMRSFMPTLLQLDRKPAKIIFMNSGVKLTAEGSPVLEHLQALEKDGVMMLVCGTCLDYFGLKAQIKVGRVSNMFEIVETLSEADLVLSM